MRSQCLRAGLTLAALFAAGALFGSVGCEGPVEPAKPAVRDSNSAPAPMPVAKTTDAQSPIEDAPTGSPPGESPPPQDMAVDNVDANREEAKAGVGEKGRGYGGGILTEAIHAKFLMEDRIDFEVMKHNLDLYKAEHDNKGPKTHEAFMRDIIEANLMKLPELPEGDKYLYDPKTETLFVVHPK